MFIRHRTTLRDRNRRRKAALLVVTALVTVAACAPRSAQYSEAESQRSLRVDRAVFHHTVNFAGRSSAVGDAEMRKLARFLSRHSADPGIEARVSGGGSRIDAKRRAAVLAVVKERGYAAKTIYDPEAQSGQVRLRLVRYVVTLPRCGDWSREAIGDSSNTSPPNFGCATTTNLGLMVANPGVLVNGTDIGPGDGDRLARGVKAYRRGKEKQPPTISPLVIQSGAGK